MRRGFAYRCDRLSQLTERDHATLSQLGVVTVIDFRYEREVTEDPSRLWPSVANHVEIPMAGKLAQEKTFLERAFAGEMDGINDDWVFESYVDILTDHPIDYATAIRHVAASAPSLFHCTAGKDRTGLMTMLLLSVAGVDRELILDDFDLSNRYRAEPRMAALAPMFAERDSTSRSSDRRSERHDRVGQDAHLARRRTRRTTRLLDRRRRHADERDRRTAHETARLGVRPLIEQ